MKHLLKEKPANINNTNNTNNTNDTNNFINDTTLNWSFRPSNEQANETSSLPLEISQEIDSESHLEERKSERGERKNLPPEWRGVKLDLFCNGKNKDGSDQLKLNIGVLRKLDGAQIELQAVLNSAFDDSVRRGVEKTDWNTAAHWIKVKQHRKELSYLIEDLRASKIGKKSKGGGTDWVAFVYLAEHTWCVDIVRECQIYHFELTGKLSEKQIAQGNTIATGYFGQRKQATLINPRKEWGI